MVKVGLALGGGAGLGWAHIGIIRRFEDAGIPIDYIAGTSIGSIVGAAYAAGKLDDLEQLARSFTFKEMLLWSEIGFKSSSVIGGSKIEAQFRSYFADSKIEDLQKPFAAIAADLYTGDEVVFDKGDVVTALQASSAVPGLLPAIKHGEKLLVDGGVVNPVPVDATRRLGADYVIAVDLQGDFQARVERMHLQNGSKKRPSAVKVARAGLFLALSSLGKARMKLDLADHIITPAIGHIEIADFTKANQLIELGKKAADTALPVIEKHLSVKVLAE
ncbi:patatin family protein [Kordiimonas sediminis]|uniref:Patatin family protein n=1 Tax=Kordiimonas sediminis TaxID=1735581 RepID=A0A919AX42_9PROT|nr:patatin-like phospholipase family protein [Kordiimonas sediminis]GHF27295.1 patatin family protein [Kordiimonas sediminis]